MSHIQNSRRIDEFIEGLQILAKYDKKGLSLQAERDELICEVDEEPTADEVMKLLSLGWQHEERNKRVWGKLT